MPRWIHDRAEHLLAKNPDMNKSTAFAIATQQGHKLGKNPKGYGTVEGKSTAKEKYDKPKKSYVKGANPGKLNSPKLKSASAASEVAGLGILAAPSIDHLQAIARAQLAKDKSRHAVEKRRFLGDTVGHAAEVGGLGILAAPYAKELLKRAEVFTTGDKKAMISFKAFNDEFQKISLAGGLKLAAMPLPPSMLKGMAGSAAKGLKTQAPIKFMPKPHAGGGMMSQGAMKAGLGSKNPALRQNVLANI